MLKFLKLNILVKIEPEVVEIGVDADGVPQYKNVWMARSDSFKITAHDSTPDKALKALENALMEAEAGTDSRVEHREAMRKGNEPVVVTTMSEVAVTLDEKETVDEPVERDKGQSKRGRPKKQKNVEDSPEDSDQVDMDFD